MTRARLTVDLDAVAANWRALDGLSAPTVETAAVVKADAYGLGLAPVAEKLHATGARSFFVALAEEGVALRAVLGPGAEILVFSGYMAGDKDAVAEHALVPLLNSAEQAARFLADLPGAACGVQIESGMNRLGMEAAEAGGVAGLLPPAQVRLVMSHLACADDPEHVQNAAQLAEFKRLSALFPGARLSLAATGGILLGPAFHFALTRPGVGLYGGLPFADAAPVVKLELPVIQTRTVAAGETVGYGAAWMAERASRIATVAAGYADGLIRAMGNRARLFAGSTACPLAGRVSMDLLTVDVTDLAEVPQTLSVLGARQGVDALAEAAGTIGYEILTSLGQRYERVYKGGV